MPTDLAVALVRKNAARAEMQNDISVLLTGFIICLATMMLLFASPIFAEAMALLGMY
jgi:hypothetical protein